MMQKERKKGSNINLPILKIKRGQAPNTNVSKRINTSQKGRESSFDQHKKVIQFPLV